MPRQEYKESTINDQAYILKFSNSPNYYLRLKGRGGKDTSLETDDLERARLKALEVYANIKQYPAQKRQRNYLFKTACEKWLESKQERVDIGRIKQRSYDTYRARLYERIIPFANETGIKKVDDMNRKSWRDKYFVFYRKVKTKGKWNTPTEGLAVGTINDDISTINELLNWMIDKEILDPRNVVFPKQETDNKNYREDASPAFLPDAWKEFKKALFAWEKKPRTGTHRKYSWDNFVDEERAWRNTWFVHWILFQYHLGSRPHETEKIRLRDIHFKTLDNGQKKGIVQILPETKRGKRISVVNGHALQKVKDHLKKGIKIRNKQAVSFNQMIEEKYSEMSTEKLCRQFKRINPETRRWELYPALNDDHLLMSNPFGDPDGPSMYTPETMYNWYKEVKKICNFKENYTFYSLRSTHITHNILNGIRDGNTRGSIEKLCTDNCGTSVGEINSTYYRINKLLNIDLLDFHQNETLSKDLLPEEIQKMKLFVDELVINNKSYMLDRPKTVKAVVDELDPDGKSPTVKDESGHIVVEVE